MELGTLDDVVLGDELAESSSALEQVVLGENMVFSAEEFVWTEPFHIEMRFFNPAD